MSSCQVRRFIRADRDQVASLVNAHVSAVVPAVAVSVSGLMSQLERDPGEFIVDPWVAERLTLVAEQRQRVVAAAHLLRYSTGPEVPENYRGAGEIRWLVFWPDAPYWPDAGAAGEALATACMAQLQRWNVTRCYADGALPAPGVYGVPDQWPHVREVYHRLGFTDPRRSETVFLARVSELPRRSELPGLTPRRTLGINGTRISAVLEGTAIGYIEVADRDENPRTLRTRGWADIGNLEVSPPHNRSDIGVWLLAQAADWLELGEVTRLLSYADTDDLDEAKFLTSAGFRVLTRTVCELTLDRPEAVAQ
jgi:GNAT superfamily N-acetyltransferase